MVVREFNTRPLNEPLPLREKLKLAKQATKDGLRTPPLSGSNMSTPQDDDVRIVNQWPGAHSKNSSPVDNEKHSSNTINSSSGGSKAVKPSLRRQNTIMIDAFPKEVQEVV